VNPADVAAAFSAAPILGIEPLGRGLINDTFLVATPTGRFVLQRINTQVFPEPAAILTNLRILLDHVGQVRKHAPAVRDLEFPTLIPRLAGGDGHVDAGGGYWRALSFIEGTCNHDRITDAAEAAEVGYALGRFHALVNGLDPGRLHDTLPGFHITPAYLARFDAALARPLRVADGADLRWAFRFVEARRPCADVLEAAKRSGQLRLRVIHGDPKVDNVLFSATTGAAASLIDLDTVKPGLIHYDLGDCLRSGCNRLGESAETAEFDLDLARAILQGYWEEARRFLGGADRAFLYDAIRLLPFELGLRFLTDHLEGDVYFKVEAPGQNLRRALTQFCLAKSVERQESALRSLIGELA
jgi:Ser/Thr protein kinase RdoA (MazF antagonist)